MAEYESQKVKDTDAEQARGDYEKYSQPMSGIDRMIAEMDERAILKEAAGIMGNIKNKGMTGGDCGRCGTEDVHLYLDLCHECTAMEVWQAVSQMKIGPLLEKYGI